MKTQIITRVFLKALGREYFLVSDADGRVIVPKSKCPERAACRYLRDRKVSGRLEVWWETSNFPATTFNIEPAAELVTADSDHGLRITPWIDPKTIGQGVGAVKSRMEQGRCV